MKFKINKYNLLCIFFFYANSKLCAQENTTFEFSGVKSTSSIIMDPDDKNSKNGFKIEMNYEWCFVNCGAWKTPVLFFNILPNYRLLGYYKEGKYYDGVNSNDAKLKELIKSVSIKGYFYLDVNLNITKGSGLVGYYKNTNVLMSSSNVGCFDANTRVWFNEKDETDNRAYVKNYSCDIHSYLLKYQFLEGPCKELNKYIDDKYVNIPKLKEELKEAKEKKSVEAQFQIANQLFSLDNKDYDIVTAYNDLKLKVENKKELKLKLSALPETSLNERLELRKQIYQIDKMDVENNFNIESLEKAIEIQKSKEEYKQNQKDKKDLDPKPSTTSVPTVVYQPPAKTKEQIIAEGTSQVVGIIVDAIEANKQAKIDYQNKVDAYNKKQEIEEENRQRKDKNNFNERVNNYYEKKKKDEQNYPDDFSTWYNALANNTAESYKGYLIKYGKKEFLNQVNLTYQGNSYYNYNTGFYADVAMKFYQYHTNQLSKITNNYETENAVKEKCLSYAIAWEMWDIVKDLINKNVVINSSYLYSEYQPQYRNYHILHKLNPKNNLTNLNQFEKVNLIKSAASNSFSTWSNYTAANPNDEIRDDYIELMLEYMDLSYTKSIASGKNVDDKMRASIANFLLLKMRNNIDTSRFLVESIKVLVDNKIDYKALFQPWYYTEHSKTSMYEYDYFYVYPFERHLIQSNYKTMLGWRNYPSTYLKNQFEILKYMVEKGGFNKTHLNVEVNNYNSLPYDEKQKVLPYKISQFYENIMINKFLYYNISYEEAKIWFDMGFYPELIPYSKGNLYRYWQKKEMAVKVNHWDNYKYNNPSVNQYFNALNEKNKTSKKNENRFIMAFIQYSRAVPFGITKNSYNLDLMKNHLEMYNGKSNVMGLKPGHLFSAQIEFQVSKEGKKNPLYMVFPKVEFQIQNPNIVVNNSNGYSTSYKPFKSFGLMYGVSKYYRLGSSMMINLKFFAGTNISSLPQVILKDEFLTKSTFTYAKSGGNFGIQLKPEIGLKIRKFNLSISRQWIMNSGKTTYETTQQSSRPIVSDMKVKYTIHNLLISLAFVP